MLDIDAFYSEVGRRIRDGRKKRVPPLTQEELGDRVDLTRTSITNIEKGRQKFLLHTLAQIAAELQVPVISLLPAPGTDGTQRLEHALKDRPKSEKEWITSLVSAVQRGKTNDGP